MLGHFTLAFIANEMRSFQMADAMLAGLIRNSSLAHLARLDCNINETKGK